MDILKKNYFETFGLPIAVDIDHSRLEQQFTNLQKQFHPDKYNSSSEHEKRLALQVSSYLNDGYVVLSDTITRIEYILKINNYTYDESKTFSDNDFMLEQISLNEEIESVHKNDRDKIKLLNDNIISKMNNMLSNIEKFLTSNDYEDVWINLAKYKFYYNHYLELERIREL